MTALALAIAAYAFAVLLVPDMRPPFLRDRVTMLPLAVYTHLAASAAALAIGPFQFSSQLRSRRLAMHRWSGRVYLISVLLGGASGFILAFASQAGVVAHMGFAMLAAAWLLTGIRAYQRIRLGDQTGHRRWMIRNYSLTFAAVTLRIYLPVALIAGAPFEQAYSAIAWLCWIPNLIVAERRWVHRAGPFGASPTR